VAAFVHLSVQGRPYVFQVDTGATTSAVDSAVAKALALPDRGAATSKTTVGAKTSAQPVAISDWKLGDEALPTSTVLAVKTAFTGHKINGVPFGGLLGPDVLSRFGTLTLDFAGQRLVLGGKPPRGGQSIPVKLIRPARGAVALLVQASIRGMPVVYAIDTGASTTSIDARTTKQLGLQAAGKPRTIAAVSSPTVVTPVRIEGWTAGGVKLPSTIVASSRNSFKDKAVVGVLGADVLSTFGEVTFDFAGQRMTLGGTVG